MARQRHITQTLGGIIFAIDIQISQSYVEGTVLWPANQQADIRMT
jgi:hypothetical protein